VLVVLLWILRVLVLLLVLRFVLRLIFGSGPATRRPVRPASTPERLGGELVRDPQCGTYVPKARAIAVGSGPDTKYFCSTTCRDAYGVP
jgi:hypothetical protein